MNKHLVRVLQPAPRGFELWTTIGRRLRTRRTVLGMRVEEVAEALEISPSLYASYETGAAHAPAFLLGEIAELFGVPVPWFFQDVSFEEDEEEDLGASDAPLGVLTVATDDERVEALSECFRRLDLDAQQHLLAIAGALARSSRKWLSD
jgi:transcriptional regulator with XRE-family HTH domain